MKIQREETKRRSAFTLIEILAVTAIIGIVAALVLHMAGASSQKKKDAKVAGELAGLTAMIENYKLTLGFYPPDNPYVATASNNLVGGTNYYELYTAQNPLLYELVGTIASNGGANFLILNSVLVSNLSANNMPAVYQIATNQLAAVGIGGIANSDTQSPRTFYKPAPQPTAYAMFTNMPPALLGAQGLLVGVDGPDSTGAVTIWNFWHYDSSSPRRHNLNSYDLWAEYATVKDSSGKMIIKTNGNF